MIDHEPQERSRKGRLLALVVGALVFVLALAGCRSEQPATATPTQRLTRALTPAPTVTPSATAVSASPATPTSAPTAASAAPVTATLVGAISPSADPGSPPVRLVIPALGIDTPVIEVAWGVTGEGDNRRSVWQTADYAAGHHINSANLGQVGNVVISGHHNTKGKVFEQISRDVDRREPRLKVGTPIEVYAADGRAFTYAVEEVVVLDDASATPEERAEHARWMAPTAEPVLTLITCWPLWTNTHRVIVRGRLVAP